MPLGSLILFLVFRLILNGAVTGENTSLNHF